MRMTIELPDEIFRRIKTRAAQGGTTLKKLVTTYVEQGLHREASPISKPPRQRSPIPIARPATGQPVLPLANAGLQQILIEDDLTREFGS